MIYMICRDMSVRCVKVLVVHLGNLNRVRLSHSGIYTCTDFFVVNQSKPLCSESTNPYSSHWRGPSQHVPRKALTWLS